MSSCLYYAETAGVKPPWWDRLSWFGVGLLETYFGSHGVEIEWTDEVLGKSYDAVREIVEDILSLMASFSARIYGRRSAENRKRAKEDVGVAG